MDKVEHSYGQIFKSSSLMGGSQAIVLLIGIVQVKFVAVLLGPLGIGLVSTLSSLLGLASRLAGLGIKTSGVKRIAECSASGDEERLSKTVLILRRVCWLTGTLGMVVFAVTAKPISIATFSSTEFTWSIILISIVILIRNIEGAQLCMIQGMRRIGDLANLKFVGALGGAVIAIPVYAWIGVKGIVPVIIAVAIFQLSCSWLFARKLKVPRFSIDWIDSLKGSGELLRLGLVFMSTGVLVAVVALLTRVMINWELGLFAVGIFQSSFRLSGMLVTFVLGAMGADFYPRLSAVANDNEAVNKLVCEQTEIGLLLAIPGLLTTMVFAPWIIQLFYSIEFLPAVELLGWFLLGCLGRVISWPMGFILMVKGRAKWLILTESTASVLHVILIWLGLKIFGVLGVAMAFAWLYLAYVLLMIFVSSKISGFRWNDGVNRLLAIVLPAFFVTFSITQLLDTSYSISIGAVILIGLSHFCLREIAVRLGSEHKFSQYVVKIPLISLKK